MSDAGDSAPWLQYQKKPAAPAAPAPGTPAAPAAPATPEGPWTAYQDKPAATAKPAETKPAEESDFLSRLWTGLVGTEQKPTMVGAAGRGFGQAVGDVGYGAAQLGARLMDSAGQGVPEQAPGVAPQQPQAPPGGSPPDPNRMARQIDRLAQQREQAFQRSPGVRQHPYASEAGRFAGDVATAVPLMVGGAGATLPAKVALGGVRGAAGALTQPVTSGKDYWSEKAGQLQTGATFGAGIPAVGGALAPALPTPQSVARAFPWVRNFVTGTEERTVEGFDRTIARQALDFIGGTIKPRSSGHELMEEVTQNFNRAYDRVLPNIQLTETTFRQPNTALQNVISELGDDHAKQYATIMQNRVYSKLDNAGGVLDGQAFKQVQSDLSARAHSFLGTNNNELGRALLETLKHLNASVIIDSGAAGADLKRINDGFMIFAKMRAAGERSATAEGKFSPADWLKIVNSEETSPGAFARGKSILQLYGEMGNRALSKDRSSPAELLHIFTRHGLPLEIARQTAQPVGRALKATAPYTAPVAGKETSRGFAPPPGELSYPWLDKPR